MNSFYVTLIGLGIPFLGTALGSACVFFMKRELRPSLQKTLTEFAAGVMVAASVWSLLIPSMEQAASSGGSGISFMSAFALSLGIAIQNFPEGAIISMPLHAWDHYTCIIFYN